MTFADLGHLLIDLLDSLPTTSRKYLVQSTLPLKDPSPPFWRQRELLPLPMIIFVDRELPRKCSEARGSMSYGSARNVWTPLRLSAVSCEYHLATRSRAASITWRRWRSGRTASPPTCKEFELLLFLSAFFFCRAISISMGSVEERRTLGSNQLLVDAVISRIVDFDRRVDAVC